MEWDWNFVWQIMPTMIEGVKITILATLLGAALAAVVGLLIAVLRRSPNPWVSRPVAFFAEFIRGTPLLVQLYFIFYVLPDIGILLPALLAGVIGLGLHYGTYTAEVKETPLLSAITILELMNQAKSVANTYYRYIEPITLVGAFFLAISLVAVVLLRWLEHRYGRIER